MLWRILSAVIVLFWAVMTGLIIRDTYFPDHSRFAVIPPRFVFDLFLSEAASFNNALHLYHEDERIGYTTFTIRRESGNVDAPVYSVTTSGSVTLVAANKQTYDISYRLTGELLDAERWRSFDLEVKSQDSNLFATIAWKMGDKLPKIEVKKGEQVLMNTQLMQTLMAMKGGSGAGMIGGDWLAKLPTMQQEPGASALTAREGIMELAGKKRRCYIVSLKLMRIEEVRAYFTEVGELARIELPQGYRFIEPMMHGLERDINTMK